MSDCSKEAIIRSLALYCENACSDSWVDQVYPSQVERDAQEVLRTLCRQSRSFDIGKFEYIVNLLSPYVDQHACDSDGRSQLFEGVYSGKQEIVRQQTQKYGLDMQHRDRFGRNQQHELFGAPWSLNNAQGLQNSVEILHFCQFLCQSGVSGNVRDAYGCTPLSLSLDGYFPHVSEVQVLHGASLWSLKPCFLFYLACKPHLLHAAYGLRDVSSSTGTTRRIAQCTNQHFLDAPINLYVPNSILYLSNDKSPYLWLQREQPHEFKRQSLLLPSCYGHQSVLGAQENNSTFTLDQKNGDYKLSSELTNEDINTPLVYNDQGSTPLSPFCPITSTQVAQHGTGGGFGVHQRPPGVEVSTFVFANTFSSASFLNTTRFCALALDQRHQAECCCDIDFVSATPTVFPALSSTLHCPLHSVQLRSSSPYSALMPQQIRTDSLGRNCQQVLLKYGCTRAFLFLLDVLIDVDGGFHALGGSKAVLGYSLVDQFTQHTDKQQHNLLVYAASHPYNVCLTTHSLFSSQQTRAIVDQPSIIFKLVRCFQLCLPLCIASLYSVNTTSTFISSDATQTSTLLWLSAVLTKQHETGVKHELVSEVQWQQQCMEHEPDTALVGLISNVLCQMSQLGGLNVLLSAQVQTIPALFSQAACLVVARVAPRSIKLAETICLLMQSDLRYTGSTVPHSTLEHVMKVLIHHKAWNALLAFLQNHSFKIKVSSSLVQNVLLSISTLQQDSTHFPYICGLLQYVATRVILYEPLGPTTCANVRQNQLFQLSRISGVYISESLVRNAPPPVLHEEFVSPRRAPIPAFSSDGEQTVLLQPSFSPRLTEGNPVHPFDVTLNATGVLVKFPVLSYAAVEPPVSTHSYRVMPVVSGRNDIFESWTNLFGLNLPFTRDSGPASVDLPPLSCAQQQMQGNSFSEFHSLLVLSSSEQKKTFLPIPSVPSFSAIYRYEGRWCVHFPLDHSALYTLLYPYHSSTDNSLLTPAPRRSLACDNVLPAQRGFLWQVLYANVQWNALFQKTVVVRSISYSLQVSFNPVLYSCDPLDVVPFVQVQHPGIHRVDELLNQSTEVKQDFLYNSSLEPFFQLLSSPKSSHCYSQCTSASLPAEQLTDVVTEWILQIARHAPHSTFTQTIPFLVAEQQVHNKTLRCLGTKEGSNGSSSDSSGSLFTPRQFVPHNNTAASSDAHGYLYTMLHTALGIKTIPLLQTSTNISGNIQDLVDVKVHMLEFQLYNTHIGKGEPEAGLKRQQLPRSPTIVSFNSQMFTLQPTGLMISPELAPKEVLYDLSWITPTANAIVVPNHQKKPSQGNRFSTFSSATSSPSAARQKKLQTIRYLFDVPENTTARVVPGQTIPNLFKFPLLLVQRLHPSVFLFSSTMFVLRQFEPLQNVLQFFMEFHRSMSGTILHELVKANMHEELHYFLDSIQQ